MKTALFLVVWNRLINSWNIISFCGLGVTFAELDQKDVGHIENEN